MKIVITAPFAAQQVEQLRKDHEVWFQPQTEDVPLRTQEQLHHLLLEEHAEIFICESDVVSAQVLEGLTALKAVCVCRAGLNDVDLEACTIRGIAVINTPGRNAAAVADMVVALSIGMSRFLFEGERILRAGQWDEGTYYRLRGRELYGRTAAFVGFGAIPRELSRRLQAFDMRLIAYDPYLSEEDMAEYGVQKASLEEVFSRGDFVTVHVPVTRETKGLVNRRLLERMKPDAYFVNAARADIVNEADVIEHLKNHRIAGAAFDVYGQEPLPPESPFLALDHVVLIPHLGGASLNVVDNHSRMVVSDLRLFWEGKRPLHLANPGVLA